jgi:hypothetical protein
MGDPDQAHVNRGFRVRFNSGKILKDVLPEIVTHTAN